MYLTSQFRHHFVTTFVINNTTCFLQASCQLCGSHDPEMRRGWESFWARGREVFICRSVSPLPFHTSCRRLRSTIGTYSDTFQLSEPFECYDLCHNINSHTSHYLPLVVCTPSLSSPTLPSSCSSDNSSESSSQRRVHRCQSLYRISCFSVEV